MWAAALSWLGARPWAIAALVLAVVFAGLYGQNLFYSWRIDTLTEQRDAYRASAKRAIERAEQQNRAVAELEAAAAAKTKAAERRAAAARKEALTREAQIEALRRQPRADPNDPCVSACVLLRQQS